MDPYDAIVEQLTRARERQQQSLEQQLASVLESLESATASIRQTLETPAAEAFPLDDVEASLSELRQAADDAAAAAAVPPPVPPVSLEVLRVLDEARSQSDLLHGLLSELAKHSARAVVLVFRPDGVGAWSAIGFDEASRLGRWSCGRDASPVFASFEDNAVPVRFSPADDEVFRGWLEGEPEPDEALLVPISLRGRIMGAVYADRLADGPWDPEAIQLLVAISCWMIDTLKHRSAAPSPALRDVAGVSAPAAVEPEELIEEAAEETTWAEPAEEQAEEAVAPGEAEVEEPGIETEVEEPVAEPPEPSVAALDELAAEPGFDPSATVQVEPVDEVAPSFGDAGVSVETRVDLSAAADAAVVEDQAPESMVSEADVVPEEVVETAEMELPPPVEPVRPPADFQPAQPEPERTVEGIPPEDQSRHEEARRFARLLVSEIKLYNEDAVERGRQQRDLYHRLKDDIDRSREMYEKRIPADVRDAHDHFQDELVRILAGGDAGALGS